MDLFSALFGSAPEPEPVIHSRTLLSMFISWIFRAFITIAVLIAVLVIAWQIIKYFFFRQVPNVVRPEYTDLVDRIRQWFNIQHIRDVPAANQQRPRHDADSNCPICLLDPAEMPIQTNCGHVFCGNCIVTYWRQGTWGNDGVKCPVCRQKVTLLMRDMRPGVVMPPDSDRAAEIEEDIRRYNRRFSGEPRSWLEKLRDLPSILQHFTQNLTFGNGLGLIFRSRMVIYIILFLAYFILPFDLLPESFLGIFGFADDFIALTMLLTQLAQIWRNVVVRDEL
ncbi:E3 ubiquitin-protein ligase RNF170-like [Paramacrobiotus metropolitanus]|uniref:E3 ubiquitin-protein ligase RNF170-like n=1 Tax=Paramacrobiotus metropolitanus TaxID=2943436 RepID=UPI002445D875|nr:E3 ubiquitin-protein ligase RNF170-like [Paramacrobiotus metropolitanus]